MRNILLICIIGLCGCMSTDVQLKVDTDSKPNETVTKTDSGLEDRVSDLEQKAKEQEQINDAVTQFLIKIMRQQYKPSNSNELYFMD